MQCKSKGFAVVDVLQRELMCNASYCLDGKLFQQACYGIVEEGIAHPAATAFLGINLSCIISYYFMS